LVDTTIVLDIDTDETIDLYNDYLRLVNMQKLMSMYKELGNDGIYFLNYLYNQLTRQGFANKKDIRRIIGVTGELGNLGRTLIETASDIGGLNYFKSNIERDVDELTRKIDDYDAILLERGRQARQF
jgi:hypothetical protein